ncbi:Ankyrin repeat and BTB/POZ domain-containing protein 1 [Varicellaria rhodocarpa]|nr:Ankyrin repeat and BTB/POZ domain-containing protein 1 [Varicellaria rhodocarpa]
MADTALHDPLLPVSGERHVSPLRHKLGPPLRKFQESMQELCPKKMILLVFIFGFGTGVVAWFYNSFFEAVVHLAWEKLPENAVRPLLQHLSRKVSWFPEVDRIAWVYTVLLSTGFGFLAGMTQRVLGSPGDLPDTVRDIHEKGYISITKAPSMFLCSTFSIAAGGSLGPEAPLLALCGASCSWFGRRVLRYKGHKLRNCALLGGCAAATASTHDSQAMLTLSLKGSM